MFRLVGRIVAAWGVVASATLSAPVRGEDLTFSGTGTVRILASDWADYIGGSPTFLSANDGGRIFYRGTPDNAGDGNYVHFDLRRLQGLTMQSDASVTLQNTDAQYGGSVSDSFIATANGAWTAAGGAAVPGATAVSGALNPTGVYGTGTSVSWGIGSAAFQAVVSSASTFNGFAIIGGPSSRMHFFGPMSPYLSVATSATMNGVVTVAGGGAWNSSNYSFTDGVLSIAGEVAGGQSGAGDVTINSLGTVFVNGNYNKYWAIDSTRINAGGVLLGYGHSHLHNLTLAGGELAGIRPDGTYGTWAFDDATTVTGGVTSTISAQQVGLDNGNVTIDAGSTLNFTGSIRSGTIVPTIAAGGRLINGAAAGTSFSLGAVMLDGGELAATSQPNTNLGNYQLRGDVTVGGSATSTISADVRVISGEDRTFNVADVDGGGGVDLLVSGKLGHWNGTSGGSATKTGAGTMKMTGANELYRVTVNGGRLALEDAAIEGWWDGGLVNNAAVDFGVAGDKTASYGISGSGSVTKTGTGTLRFSSAAGNSYGGGTVIDGGTLNINGRSADNGGYTSLGTGAVTINANATLVAANDWALGNEWNGGNVGQVTVNQGGTLTINTAGNTIRNGLALNGGTVNGTGANGDWGGLYLRNTFVTAGGSATSTIAVDTAMNAATTFTVDAGSQLDYTGVIHNKIGGTGAIAKAGAGTLALSGSNTYTGVTTFSGGVVNAGTFADNGAASSLGVGTGDTDNANIGLLFRGGTLQYTGSTAQSTNRAIRLSTDGGGGTIDASGSTPEATLSFTRPSMPNWWENGGSRTLTLKGSNTGPNTLAAGIDDIQNVTTIAVSKEGAGRWVLSGSGSYRGVTDVVAGTLVAANGNALGVGGLDGTTMTWVRNGATLALQGGITTDEHLHMVGTGVGGSGAIRSTSGANTMTQWIALDGNTTVGVDADTLTLTSRLYGDGGLNASTLTKAGAGTLVLAGENALTGATVVNNGTLRLNSSLRNSSSITVNSGLLDVAATNVLSTDHGTQYNVLITIAAGGTVATSNGSVNRIGNVALRGGSLTANTSDGNYGSYYIAQANNADPTVMVSGSVASTINGAGNIKMWSNVNFDVADVTGTADADLTVSAVLDNRIVGDGSAGITKTGVGALALASTNNYSGRTVLAGGVVNAAVLSDYGSPGSLGNRAAASDAGGDVGILFQGGTLQYTGATPQSTNRGIRVSTFGGGGTIDASGSDPGATLTFSASSSPNFFEEPGTRALTFTGINTGSNTFAMAIGEAGGTTAVVKSGTGTWVLSGNSSYSGGTTLGAGRLVAGSATAFGSGTVSAAAGTTLDLGGFAVGNVIVNGGGGLLNATAYTGLQTVVGTTSLTGTVGGTVAVADGGTLRGSETTFTGPVTIGNGAVHSPGNSPGTQTFADGLIYTGSATLEWELVDNTESGPGTSYDALFVTGGDLTIASGAELVLEFLNTGTTTSMVNWANPFWNVNRGWTVIDFASAGISSGTFTLAGSPATWLDSTSASLESLRPGSTFNVASIGGDVVLSYTAVPEPRAIVIACAGMLVAAATVRGRRRGQRYRPPCGMPDHAPHG